MRLAMFGKICFTLFFSLLIARPVPAQIHSGPFHSVLGVQTNDPLAQLGLSVEDLKREKADNPIHFLGISSFLNDSQAVVTTTIDDSSHLVPDCIDALDRYGVKATIAISTQREPILELWPRLRQAIDNGHEIASHSRRHQCRWPDSQAFCRQAYSQNEILGSRNDILANTQQLYVWSWVYPCGNCAQYEFIHTRLSQAGYLVARNYPDEANGGVLVPNLQTWALDPYNAAFTQVVQKKGGIAPAGRTDVLDLNSKFDTVYENHGIYHFVSHPAWLDYGASNFYEQHLSHLSDRHDVWYVPLGPLYAFQVLTENTVISPIQDVKNSQRWAIYNDLDPQIYDQSITLEFRIPAQRPVMISSGGFPLRKRKKEQLVDEWDAEYYKREGDKTLITLHPNTILEIQLQ